MAVIKWEQKGHSYSGPQWIIPGSSVLEDLLLCPQSGLEAEMVIQRTATGFLTGSAS